MAIDYNELKKGGFMRQRQKDNFIARFRSLAGDLTSDQLRKLADLADKYGQGYVHLTTRQGAEIPWVNLRDCQEMREEIKALGLNIGACGSRIRTIVACPGSAVCQFGLQDTKTLARELDKTFFGREAPKKTKLAVSGCPNSCAKPQENDIGFMGVVEPVLHGENCIGCGLCQRVCPNGALTMVEDKPVIDRAKCLHEGNCIASCPVDAWQEQRRGYFLYIGGKIGRNPRLGQVVAEFVREDQVIEVIERVLAAFQVLGNEGERIGDTLARVGLKAFQEEMNWAPVRLEAVDKEEENAS